MLMLPKLLEVSVDNFVHMIVWAVSRAQNKTQIVAVGELLEVLTRACKVSEELPQITDTLLSAGVVFVQNTEFRKLNTCNRDQGVWKKKPCFLGSTPGQSIWDL